MARRPARRVRCLTAVSRRPRRTSVKRPAAVALHKPRGHGSDPRSQIGTAGRPWRADLPGYLTTSSELPAVPLVLDNAPTTTFGRGIRSEWRLSTSALWPGSLSGNERSGRITANPNRDSAAIVRRVAAAAAESSATSKWPRRLRAERRRPRSRPRRRNMLSPNHPPPEGRTAGMAARVLRPEGKGFIFLDAHPAGCAACVDEMIGETVRGRPGSAGFERTSRAGPGL